MSRTRKILNGILIALFLFFGFSYWYVQKYGMDKISETAINPINLPNSVLIASQGSDFKRQVVADVVSTLREENIYIKVIDVAQLATVKAVDWDAIVILHTWEMWKPQPEAAAFINRVADKNKLVVLSTSGEGSVHMEGIDALTSASVVLDIPIHVQNILDRVYGILKAKKPTTINGNGCK